MDRKKIIYIGLLLIVTVIVSVTYFSYAFFTKTDEQHGKLNVVVGTLSYELKSGDLTNNSITLSSKEKKLITIKLKSLNNIASDYKLYYTSSNSNFDIGYSSTTVDATSGTINANGEKTILISIENKNNSSITINFGVVGGFVGKTLTLNTGQNLINTEFDFSTCDYETNYVWNFPYNGTDGTDGSVQPFTVPCDGRYKLEVWGAQGGTYSDSGNSAAGKGGYSRGTITLNLDTLLYINVGGKGGYGSSSASGGYNGGGSGRTNQSSTYVGGGGGATDIRVASTSLYSRVIVAGAGGGGLYTTGHSSFSSPGPGGYGGGETGGTSMVGLNPSTINGSTSYGTLTGITNNVINNSSYVSANSGGNGFGIGGSTTSNSEFQCGGGSGWYGGGTNSAISGNWNMMSSGAGGSGWVYTASNYSLWQSSNSSDANQYQLSSNYYLTDASTIAGNTSFPAPSGGNETGHSGHGHARITYLGD